jgi:hypothetical protein
MVGIRLIAGPGDNGRSLTVEFKPLNFHGLLSS